MHRYYITVNVVMACVSAAGGILGILFSLWMFINYEEFLTKLIVVSLLLLGAFFISLMNIKVEKRKLREKE